MRAAQDTQPSLLGEQQQGAAHARKAHTRMVYDADAQKHSWGLCMGKELHSGSSIWLKSARLWLQQALHTWDTQGAKQEAGHLIVLVKEQGGPCKSDAALLCMHRLQAAC